MADVLDYALQQGNDIGIYVAFILVFLIYLIPVGFVGYWAIKFVSGDTLSEKEAREKAVEKTEQFLKRIPEIRGMLAKDVQAAYDGDPAAFNTDEVIVQQLGDAVILVPKESLWQTFMAGLDGFTSDVFADGRDQGVQKERENL